MATSRQFLSAPSAFTAAPLPRPPQPIRPIFKRSSPAAWAPRAIDSPPAKTPAAAKAEVAFKKSRRLGLGGFVTADR